MSDPHERAWYDDHKEDILRGVNATGDDATGGHTVNVWPFFSSSAYGDFDDKVDGFYTVYRQFFEKVLEEEKYISYFFNTFLILLLLCYRQSSKDAPDYPSFGNSATDLSKVLEFYTKWSNFSTVKSFAWCDEYDTTDVCLL